MQVTGRNDLVLKQALGPHVVVTKQRSDQVRPVIIPAPTESVTQPCRKSSAQRNLDSGGSVGRNPSYQAVPRRPRQLGQVEVLVKVETPNGGTVLELLS